MFSWGAVVATSNLALACEGDDCEESFEEELSEDELEQLLADEEIVEVSDDEGDAIDGDEEVVEVNGDDPGTVEVQTAEAEVQVDESGAAEVKTAEVEVKTDESGAAEVKTTEVEAKVEAGGDAPEQAAAVAKVAPKQAVKDKMKRKASKNLFVLIISSATEGKLSVDGKSRGSLKANKARAIPMKPGRHVVRFNSGTSTRTFKVVAKAGARKKIRISNRGKVRKGRTKGRKGAKVRKGGKARQGGKARKTRKGQD